MDIRGWLLTLLPGWSPTNSTCLFFKAKASITAASRPYRCCGRPGAIIRFKSVFCRFRVRQRCFKLGKSLRKAILSYPEDIKVAIVVGTSNLHIYAAMRGQSLDDFQKTRNAQVLYSVAGQDKGKVEWDKTRK